MFVAFQILLKTELSDTRDILASRTHSRLWLSHRCHHHPAPSSTFLGSANKNSLLWSASLERRRMGCDRRIPLGLFAEQRGELSSHRKARPWPPLLGSCREAGQQNDREARPSGPRPALRVTATRPCWVWVKRPGEQTCFLDLKLLSWATLVTASVREGSSSSLAAITIQLTFMLSLRTPAKRAALLTDPQPLANCVHKLNCKQLNVFQAATPSYEGRTEWSEQPPSSMQLRMGAMRDFQTATETASQPTGGVLQRAGNQIKLCSSTTGRQGDFQQQHLKGHKVTSNRSTPQGRTAN